MTKLNLTATDSKQKTVLEHLIPLVSDTLAEKINNGVVIEKDGKRLINKKDLSTFMTYAAEQAKKMLSDKERNGAQAVCVHGDDIMSWAIHYLEENSIEGNLYNEDGTEYKAQKPVTKSAKSTVPYTPPKPAPKPQLSLFDMLGVQKKPADDPEPVDEEEDDEPTEEDLAEAMEQEQQTSLPLPPIQTRRVAWYENYLSVKEKYKDYILFYRLGDFYEIYGNDATTAAKLLDLTLTGRDCGLTERIPMAGIPYHAADTYISKLVSRGYRVAIAERINGEIQERIIETSLENLNIDETTGEVLPVEEMQKFDGDIEEPSMPVSKVEMPEDEDDLPPIDTKAFDVEALSVLDELFGDSMILR